MPNSQPDYERLDKLVLLAEFVEIGRQCLFYRRDFVSRFKYLSLSISNSVFRPRNPSLSLNDSGLSIQVIESRCSTGG